MTVAERLQHIWWSRRTPPLGLRALAGLFGVAVSLRRRAYAQGLLHVRRVGRPVIVVGNLTVGGSGKTPLVLWCCEQLRELGYRVGVVLRGYGGQAERAGEPRHVRADSDPASVGDEAVLLAARSGCPVVAGRDRVRAAEWLVAAGVDVIVCDDGLQHLHLGRDLELVVIDAGRGLGNGYLLPAGPLREPSGRLVHADALVLNGAGDSPPAGSVPCFRMQLHGDELRSLGRGDESLALARLAGQPVHAVAGIGNPERFFALLRAAGIAVIAHPFPDHHRYRSEELRFADGLPVLMTEKDAVKCRRLEPANAWYLPVTVTFPVSQSVALRQRLDAVVRASRGAAGVPVPL